MELPIVTIFLFWCCLVCMKLSTANEENLCYCPKVVYLQHGKQGMIPCQCDHYNHASWYTKEGYDSHQPSIINFDKTSKRGSGYSKGKYDIDLSGALIIRNVTQWQNHVYRVIFAQDELKNTVDVAVYVVVTVSPTPLHPIIQGHADHQYVYISDETHGTLTCGMVGVYPRVNLTLESEADSSDIIEIQPSPTISKPNVDGTYNVSITSQYKVDLSAMTATVQCRVTGNLSSFFNHTTTVELRRLPIFPLINEGIYPGRVSLYVNRTGQVRCSMKNVSPHTDLAFQVIESYPESKIEMSTERSVSSHGDKNVDISLTAQYNMKDHTLDSIVMECKMTVGGLNDERKTTVHLHFPKAPPALPNPVIDGCYSTPDHCVLDVKREGKITCSVRNSPNLVDLNWELPEEYLSQIVFKRQPVFVQEQSNSFHVSNTILYTVKDESMSKVTAFCNLMRHNTTRVLKHAKASFIFYSGGLEQKNNLGAMEIFSTSLLVFLIGLVSFLIGLVCKKKKTDKYQVVENGLSHRIVNTSCSVT